jgi:quinoprotein glucose dehydrogenase
MFVFDRVTGEPVFPIEERPVPKSDVPGEQAWPTQPFPTVLPPFARQTMTEHDITPHFLTPEERATWVERLKKARKGLFNPPSTEETVAVPGAVGGVNWGNTAANPRAGLVYVMSQDFPSFYKLSTEPGGGAGAPGGGRGAANAAAAAGQRGAGPEARGRTAYETTCQSCHGGDHNGVAGAGAPTLVGLGTRMAFPDFRQVILAGRGRMPAFPQVDDATMTALFAYLGGSAGAAGRGALVADKPPPGPVVASGGAPGGLDLPSGGRGSSAYPAGVDAPSVRYYTGYGLGNPHIMTGPWSRLVAYDMNQGTMKWQVPLGVDRLAAKQGGADIGVPRGSQRMGMIVTSTGLLFATAKDGKVRAYSADDGKILWTGELPHGTEGLPAMYEANGRQFLVVCATTGLTWGPRSREGGPWTQGDVGSGEKGAYIAFALPPAK